MPVSYWLKCFISSIFLLKVESEGWGNEVEGLVFLEKGKNDIKWDYSQIKPIVIGLL